MLNKEVIENKKRMLRNFSEQGQGQRVFFEEDLKLIRDILKELEQKESILDKVTDKLKEDIDFLEFSRDRDMDNCYREDEEDRAVRVYIESILNIIEGEKK